MKAFGWKIFNTISSETSKLSDGQLRLLIRNGLTEVIFGYDKDQEFRSIITNEKIKMLSKFTQVSVIRDTYGLLGDKEAPVDRGEKVFRRLLEERYKL